jgi:putative ABC transport system permease protein
LFGKRKKRRNQCRLVTVELSLPFSAPSPYGDRDNAVAFYRDLVERAASLPGARAVTLDYTPPLAPGFNLNGGVKRADENPDERWTRFTDWRPVGVNYFRTMGIPIVRGRDFDSSDSEDAPPVVIVNQRLARRLWSDEDVLGKRLRLSSLDNNREEAARLMTVVGVVADVHTRRLDAEPRSVAYAPIFQHRDRVRGMDLVVAVAGSAEGYASMLRDLIGAVDPTIPVGRIETMDAWVHESISTPRFRAGLLTAFGALALLLALLGVYGVMSYSVSQRRQEVAVRLALGAERRDILRMMTGEGIRFVIVGQVVGVAAAIGLTRLMEGMLFGVSPTDVRVYLSVSLLLATVVLLTCYIPARRAGRVQPQEVLRG